MGLKRGVHQRPAAEGAPMDAATCRRRGPTGRLPAAEATNGAVTAVHPKQR